MADMIRCTIVKRQSFASQCSGPMDDFQMYQASQVALFHAKFQADDVVKGGMGQSVILWNGCVKHVRVK